LPVAVGVGTPVAFGRYYSLLDEVLEDRRVSEIEREEIERLAQEWGLTAGEARDAHVAYITRLVTQALADGVVTPAEQRDLDHVATALGIDPDVLAALLHPRERGTVQPTRNDRPALAGKTVCFTGELLSWFQGERITRERAEQLATQAGLIVLHGVTKKLDLLVMADPDTQSGKARKAHAYGTRLIAEAVFWSALGLRVE
jgi:DNA polymerase-3 subunit epsilon